MKIKQQGNIPEWKLDVACTFCKTVITLEKPQDIYKESHPTGKVDGVHVDYGPSTYHCECPTCNKIVNVPQKLIRKDIKAQIEYK